MSRKSQAKITVGAIIFASIFLTFILYTPNPELPIGEDETKVCQPDQMPVNVTKYYDNESKVCWNPDMNRTNPLNESVNTSG